ncbi:MAG: RDD family protein [Spongiibacteraceae bacterium]
MNKPPPTAVKTSALADTATSNATLSDATPTPAGVMRRLAAMVYDALLLFGVLFTATLPTLLLAPKQLATTQQTAISNEQVVHELPTLAGGWLFQIYLLLVFCSFFCWFWRKNGQTLGMQAWRLHIEDMSGQKISLKQCLLRLLGAAVSIACLGAGYWWIWIDKDGLSWHDRWSKSRMVVQPKAAK